MAPPVRADVLVVGAGIVGLTAAVRLQESGRRVTIVTADPPEATTSNVAAAVWFPTAVGPAARAVRWAARTREVLDHLAAHEPAAAVVPRDTLMLYRGPPGRPWWTAALAEVRDAAPGTLPAGYRHGLTFTAPLIDVPRHLPWLAARFAAAGGRTVQRRLTSLTELAGLAPAIVNASGLGAADLVGDPTVTALRGQVVRTTNPGLTVSLRDQGHPAGYTYIHPRRDDCILGGTVEPGRTDLGVDPEVTDAIVARCTALAPELADAEVLGADVGLRPARPEVRLEVDRISVPGTIVVHDYGHGGAGFTLGWGCAEEVVALLDDADR